MPDKLYAPRQCIDSPDIIRRAFWPTQDCSDISNFAYTEDPAIVILNGPGTPMVGKYDCTTKSFIWRKSIKYLSSVAYHPRARRILGYASTNSVLELDSETGEIVRELKATEFGPIGRCQNIRYATSYDLRGSSFKVYGSEFSDDPDLFLLADEDHHIAGLCSLKTGKFVWSYGQYDKAGDAPGLLNSPRDVVPTFPGGAWIADYLNHRLMNVVDVRKTKEHKNTWIFPRATCVSFQCNTPASGFFAAVAAISSERRYQPMTLVMAEFDEACLETATCMLGWAPIACNQAAFNPFNPTLLQVNQWNSVFEIDYMKTAAAWKPMARFSKPYALREKLKAGASWSSEPIVGLIQDKLLTKVYSTKDARAVIEVPSPALRLLGAPADFKWVPVEEHEVPAGKMFTHVQEAPHMVYRVTVTAGKADTDFSVNAEGS